jgi:hypothetical protein
MLIQKGYGAGDLVCFKISNGDEIIAKLVEETDTTFIITRPCTVIPGQQGLGLMQSLFSGDINTNITLNKTSVIMSTTVLKEMQAHYIKVTSGIETVPSGIIT